MSNEHTEENLELILYINNLRKTFNRKLDDQLVLIGEQRERIDFQQQLIGEQRITMDELAWQIRDLRDSVRQCCEKIEKYEVQLREQCCECHHDDNSNKKNSNNKIDVNNNNNNSFSCTNKTCGDVNRREKLCRQHHVQDEDTSIYESINFENADIAAQLQTTSLSPPQQHEPPPVPARRTNLPKLNRQYAFQQNSLYVSNLDDYERVVDYKSRQFQDSKSTTQQSSRAALDTLNDILTAAIPPPPPTSSPPSDINTNDSKHRQINNETIDRLNMLFDIQRHRNLGYGNERGVSSGGDAANSDVDEEDDNILYRVKPFKDFSRRSKRGSSKAMCSLFSNVDEDYLPKLDEEQEYDTKLENISEQRDYVQNDESIENIQKSDSNHSNDNAQSKNQEIQHKTFTKNILTEMFI